MKPPSAWKAAAWAANWFLSRVRLRFRSERTAFATSWAELGTEAHGLPLVGTDRHGRPRTFTDLPAAQLARASFRSSLTQAWISASVAQRRALNRSRAGWFGGHSSKAPLAEVVLVVQAEFFLNDPHKG